MSMRIRCGDHWHHLSPTAMAIVIEGFQEGDLISTRTHAPRCLRYAFTEERVKQFQRTYKGNNISFDWETLNGPTQNRRQPRKDASTVHEQPT